MSISLSNLIAMICSGDYISDHLVSQCLEKKYHLPLTLQEGVERFLWENELDIAIDRLIDSWPAIVSMAQEVDPSCPDEPERKVAIERLLQGLGLTINERGPLGADLIAKRLSQLRDDMADTENWGRLNLNDVRRLPIDCWSYVEHILKSTIYFYSSILGSFNKNIEKRFEKARKEHSLWPILRAMKSIEDNFTLISSDLAKQSLASREASKDFIEQSLRLYGRVSPFAGFPFERYDKTIVNDYRNFYAHNTPELINRRNLQPIKEALNITFRLVHELVELEIAPAVIYITTHGWDEYGRGFLSFVLERHINMRQPERREVELQMFKRNPSVYAKLKPYLTVPRITDRMFDPPLVPAYIN